MKGAKTRKHGRSSANGRRSANGHRGGGQTRDSIADIWGPRTPYRGRWPIRVDERLTAEPDRWVQSCCVLCSNGCALDIGVKDGKIVGVRGRAADRVNHGRLGPKGLHGWEANSSQDRLTTPLVREAGALRPATWAEAMGRIVRQVKQVREKYTSGAIAFYNTGQLLLEEYYTLSIIAQAGLGTNQIDGNTRLCTATAEQALCESFGTDGQPGSYTDFDVTDCLFVIGHNMAETQTVLWSRVLDRRRGPKRPKLIVVDPRQTPTALEADVHLAPRLGTNVAVMNGLLHLLIKHGDIDRDFIDRHTVGFDELAEVVKRYPPERVRQITGIPVARLRAAAKILGSAPTLVSTVLQGVYQSNQATAAACQVNNLNLLRGMIGRPGCAVFQMNGQPTAQNSRETGCNGEFPAFRNWHNPEHVRDLARRWNVEPATLPHWHDHAHAMEIFRHAETGSVKFLWVIGTNPAVSLPELHRIRRVLRGRGLFLVVQDAFLTETAELADVVLPAAIWGEKTGTMTNADRTVHLTLKAVEPPGEARPDLDIFLDFARRMDFRDKDGQPLVKWDDAEGAFEHWKECSRGWPCDYSRLTYAKLRGGSGVQWPCNAEHPEGAERLYTDHVFATSADRCRTYGHDLETGAARTPEEYRANDPAGRAVLKAADYLPPREQPDRQYPFWLTTGRVVYQFHTRTKTGRSPELNAAAPGPVLELAAADARRLGVKTGDTVEVRSRRGTVRAAAKVSDIEAGHVFLPFHYGYWDAKADRRRAANELTLTEWDPVSKQPSYKYAAVQVVKVGSGTVRDAVADAAGKAADRASELADEVLSAAHKERRHVPDYLALLRAAHEEFARACDEVKAQHLEESEVVGGLTKLVRFTHDSLSRLRPYLAGYGQQNGEAKEPRNLRTLLLPPVRSGSFGLLRNLHDLYLLASEIHITLTAVMQAAKALRDEGLVAVCMQLDGQNKRQLAWLLAQIQHRAPHTLVVPQ
jgi:anaerobic selenocysteine-containing dehydrogenase